MLPPPSAAGTVRPTVEEQVAHLVDWARGLGVDTTGGAAEVFSSRPWSTLVRLPTPDGPLWLKAAGPGVRYEPALLDALRRWKAPHTLLPLAVDADRGFALLPDGGSTLREVGATLPAWERLLAGHAELQRHLAPHADELRALGVPDQRPARMPGRLDALLATHRAGPPAETRRALAAAVPAYRRACAELTAAGPLPTLQHDDLHDANVLVSGTTTLVTDWGDSALAHPFGVLLVTRRSVADSQQLAADGPELARLRDAYLEPWTAEHDRSDLRALVELAAHVAKVGRSLAWQRALVAATPAELERWGDSVTGWLEELLLT